MSPSNPLPADPRSCFHRPVRIRDIGEAGISATIEPSREERAALARELELVALDAMQMRYELKPRGPEVFVLVADWSAHAVQTCGVTLEPVHQQMDDHTSVEFWTPERWARHGHELASERGDDHAEADVELPERIEGDEIDPGKLAVELLIVNLDPYPRRPGVALETGAVSTGEPAGPFAALGRLKKPDDGMPD
jgi:hypothetical protein